MRGMRIQQGTSREVSTKTKHNSNKIMKQEKKQNVLDFTNQIDELTDCAISVKLDKSGKLDFCFEGVPEMREYFFYRVIKSLNTEIFRSIEKTMSIMCAKRNL